MFANTFYLWFLLLIPLYILYEVKYKEKKRIRLRYTQISTLKEIDKFGKWLKYIPLLLRCLVLALIIIALAQPRKTHKHELIRGQGIDIIITMDVSGSMQALDFKPDNRLEAAKKIALDFIDKRKNDRIGVVVFGPNAYTQCPLTIDYKLLRHILGNIQIPERSDGTAIGMGIATSVARLKDSTAENKIIILMTDGLNNSGEIDPITAAHLAEIYNIKIYSIGIGTDKLVDFPFQHQVFGTQLRKVKIDYDMDTLHEISRITGIDRAWEVGNIREFQEVIKEIDELETTEYEIEHYYRYTEFFHILILAGLMLLLIEYLYRYLFGVEFPS